MTGLAGLLNKNNGDTAAEDKDKTEVVDSGDLSNETETVGEEDENQEAKLIATSLPIQRYRVGRFEFERGVLNLYNDDDVDEFRSLIKTLPPADRNQIKIIDKAKAEEISMRHEPGATKQFDSSVGRGRERLATGDSVVGDTPLEGAEAEGQGEKFAKLPQQAGNTPVAGKDGLNVANELNQGDVQSQAEIDSIVETQK